MRDFTYTVFLIVASVSGVLVTVFAVGVIGVLFYDRHHTTESAAAADLQRAA